MDRLSPLDALFLEAEDADRHTSMAIASVAVFDGPAPTYDEFVTAIAGRLSLVPRYRQKVREVPFDLGPPVWVDDARFDVRWHVRQTAVPQPGGDEQLRHLIGRVMAQRMDRDRPLWEYWLISGLADGRWGLISKLHHSMVDGVSASDLYRVLFDVTPTPRSPVPDDWRPTSEPNPFRLATEAVVALVRGPVAHLPAAATALAHPRRTAQRLSAFTTGLLRYAAALVPADESSLCGPIGQQRRFTWAKASRADVATVRTALGGTLNDVVLATITHGFREILIARGEAPRPNLLRSLVPVSVRAPGEEGSYANRVSSLLPFLPVHLDDPVDQLAEIATRLADLKAAHEAEAGHDLTSLAELDPFPAFATPARMIFAHPQRVVTTVTTNVPGPRAPVYALGRRAVDIIPYVPIANPVRIGVCIYTYCDGVTFGITGDYDTTPDLDVLARGIERAMAALVTAARARPATPSRLVAGPGTAVDQAGPGPEADHPAGPEAQARPLPQGRPTPPPRPVVLELRPDSTRQHRARPGDRGIR